MQLCKKFLSANYEIEEIFRDFSTNYYGTKTLEIKSGTCLAKSKGITWSSTFIIIAKKTVFLATYQLWIYPIRLRRFI